MQQIQQTSVKDFYYFNVYTACWSTVTVIYLLATVYLRLEHCTITGSNVDVQ